ncbi:MAG: transglutaminase domain-containing protein, partial [Candidatus Thermoplasmatota archaeon]|nr:transglutaminase domain-containing protein [Candidatus Thermoplasmatota archaeon]
FFFILIVSTTGCFEIISDFDLDKEVMRANPYLNKIELKNETLQQYALSIIQECQTNEPACWLNQIYRHIVENYQYISDPEDEEVIQSPGETITRNGGDCEDLTILLISLLKNIGINSYLILSDTHAYALVIDINPDSLWPYIEESLLKQVKEDNDQKIRKVYTDTIILKRKSNWYYGGDGSNLSDSFDSLRFSYNVSSTRPIDLYIVPSIQDFHSFNNETTFNHFNSCHQTEITKTNDSCTMNTYGGIILSNTGFQSASVSVEIKQYFKPSFYSLFENNTISSYEVDGKKSVVLDPTAGVYGYPGYDANETGKKTAFDPVTKDYIYLG